MSLWLSSYNNLHPKFQKENDHRRQVSSVSSSLAAGEPLTCCCKEEIEFYGLDGSDPSAEAEGFIAAIKKSAFKERKQRDNDWLCDYTATCLRGEALRWFARLEMEQPEVVENWKLMQNAILTHYPRPTDETGEKSVSTTLSQ